MSGASPEVSLVCEGTLRRSLCHGLGRMVNNLTYMDPPALSRAFRVDKHASLNLSQFVEQWSRQKSGGDSAVRSEFVITGMIFHPSRVQSELLHKEIEQSFVALTLLPACHGEDMWLLALLHAQILSAHQIERRQGGVEMKI